MSTRDWGESDIAVVGMAGRFPGARNIQEFWQNLCAGVESIRFPEDRELEARGVEAAVLREPNYVKASAVMEGVELFDAGFFGYTPREAELMDPQHRVFLECAWAALEHAAYDPERCRGAIGVFGGGTTNTYLLYNLVSNRETLSAFDPMQIDVSNGPDFVATRTSYKLNLKGPSCTVQTACSTALVAIHLAGQSLLNEECDMALAGGVSVHVKHAEGYWHLDGGNVSPDGHCRAFDARANGTIFGSGVAVVVLKRLEDAIADRDHIHAIVKGSAINNDGSMKVGFTAPSVEGQAGVITEALALAGIQADTIRYVETHGTATKLGDPIEIRALTKAFRTHTQARRFCALGSVKTNVGHLASAAGVTGFIKTVLMLEHQLLPPSLHFERPSPEIDFENSPFYVNTQLSEWQTNGYPRRAGVSSFGVGGTNAHAILEEAPKLEPSGLSRPVQLLLLSAKTGGALEAATANLATHLKEQPALNLADVAYTLQVGRQNFHHRRMVVCRDRSEAVAALDTRDPQRGFTGVAEIQDRPVVFMFPGMGDQYLDMALELYQAEPTFRQTVDHCAEFLEPILGLDVREVLYPNGTQRREAGPEASVTVGASIDLRKMLRRGDGPPDSAAQQLNQTHLAHPILFTLEYALAKLWMAWGVRPRAMIGHSIGEYVAACVAGVFSLEDALSLIARRAQLIQALPGGAMLAVLLPEDQVQPWLNGKLSLATVNTPLACVVSGETDAIAELERELLEKGVACQRVQTTHAFHSTMMAPIVEPFRELLKQVPLQPPAIPFFSNVTGDWITAAEATDPDYWARHMRQTVRFADGLQVLLRQPSHVLLEMGPGQTLTALAKQHPEHTTGHVVLASLRQPHQPGSDVAVILNVLGRLWLAGVDIDWSGFYGRERRNRLPLPTYPFERQRYWIDPKATPAAPPMPARAERKAEIADWFYSPSWKRSLQPLPPKRSGGGSALSLHPSETWLVFIDEADLASGLAKRMEQAGRSVIRVLCADRFARVADGVYTLNPRQREDYTRLLQALDALGQRPNRIVHGASLTQNRPPASSATTFQEFQDTGFYSLVFLAQALEEQGQSEPIQLWVVSNNVCQVESTDVAAPERATILSPCRVIPQEYPHITCRYLDIALAGSEARWVDQVLSETQAPSAEMVIAYRGNRRWVQSFEPVRLEENAGASGPLREKGVYLIIAGLVGVGWALAQYLARTVSAKLILIESSAFPEPHEWTHWLTTHEAQDGVSRKIQRAQALEEQGAQVLVLSADIADPADMQRALAQAIERFGDLHSAIHTPGSIGGETFRPIQELDSAECEQQLLPTVNSLFALGQVLTGRELDFCLLTSSLSSVLGGLGQTAHAAASLFMDAFAEHQNQTARTPWISVDWDVWQPEGELSVTGVNAPLAQFAIAPADGVEAARRVLTQLPGNPIIVSTADLSERLKHRSSAFVAPDLQAEGGLRSPHPRPQLASPYVAPRTDLERTIMRVWQEVFGLEQIGIDDNFFELGGNSLLAIHTMSRLKKALQARVPTATLYQKPTIRFLAELLAQDEEQAARQMAEKLAKRKAEFSRRHQVIQRRK
ncbi:MAG TPA: beta-ketoacyl synthase N-terminal-like domain-containing protein [Anaerolineae bacterium]|nr:beta-ketoacyl synthase N-terminal-like domain-containing protein [Anaerolineae bacterium]